MGADRKRERRREIAEDPGRGGCGIVALAELRRPASHELLRAALEAACCMEHRGGRLGDTGDGAGLLFRPERSTFERFLPPGRRLREGEPLVVGTVFFLPGERNLRELQREADALLRAEGLQPLGWRRVPTDPSALGRRARIDVPQVFQLFVAKGQRLLAQLDQALFKARRAIESAFAGAISVPSLNAKTTVYKALATAEQLARFYPDLTDPAFKTRVVLGHRRFSTNTFSNWHLVQPFRSLAHNGEINTIKANIRAVRDVESVLGAHGVLLERGSDSAQLDRAVELIAMTRANGLAESLRRLIPPSWRDQPIPERERRFYESSRRVLGTLGAWEGPAAIVATDGEALIGMIDRMGLRPLRWMELRCGRVIMASEMGAVAVPAEEIVRDGQLEPGGMIIADLEAGALIQPRDSAAWIIDRSDSSLRFGDLSTTKLVAIERGPEVADIPVRSLNAFGWSRARVRRLHDMVKASKEPVLSMGNDRPLAIFGENYSFYSFLNQIVAVVTNPPIDPLREGQAMDLTVYLGRSPHLGSRSSYKVSAQFKLPCPVLRNDELAALLASDEPQLRSALLDSTFEDLGEPRDLVRRVHALVEEAAEAVRHQGASIMIISDQEATRTSRLPLPPLLVVSAVHRRLSELGLRREVSLVVATGDVHEGHHLAVLLGYGATAVNPYAMFHLARKAPGVDGDAAAASLVAALVGTLKRIMSKMGITTIEGYRGSALFEAIGLSREVVDFYLPGTVAQLGGITIEDIYLELQTRRDKAADELAQRTTLSVYRKEVTNALQLVARNGNSSGDYDRFVSLVEATPPVYLRDMLAFKDSPAPLDLEQVAEGRTVIAACFRGAAMSHGALNSVAHRAIAAAFNTLGASSNCGEGGEDERRNPGGPWEADRNKIRQVASGRFGVDARYLVGADEIEIKIGQGAKPGEGGHLPGHKVTAEIAAIRKTQAGIALISPPPHHDVYSIEDLAQLITNLRAVNPRAVVSVKVPSVTNLGTIVVGIAKAGAELITISGCVGGTGAAHSGSIFHAGTPLERGLSEAHQYLVVNGIRGRVRLVADGGIKHAGDIAKVMALGADMVAFGTALMIAENCVFCHGCHKGNCPVGLTTQDLDRIKSTFMVRHREDLVSAEVKQRYFEARDGVVRYLECVAEQLRATLARLGLRHPSELVGRVDLLEQRLSGRDRWDRLELLELLTDFRDAAEASEPGPARAAVSPVNAGLVEAAREQLASAEKAVVELELSSATGHSLGATLAGAIARGELGPSPEVEVRARGYAGQGFGFAAVAGMSLRLAGYANDAVGEVMGAGASIVVVPPPGRPAEHRPHLVGNAAGYGATGGRLYVAGGAGQRFGVRNSGAALIAEGVGKYAFEYMTGGIAIVLGPVGGCLGSGMTAGEVFVLDPERTLEGKLHEDVFIQGGPIPKGSGDQLRALLEDFLARTDSAIARTMLGAWPARLPDLRRVRSRLQGDDSGARSLPSALSV